MDVTNEKVACGDFTGTLIIPNKMPPRLWMSQEFTFHTFCAQIRGELKSPRAVTINYSSLGREK